MGYNLTWYFYTRHIKAGYQWFDSTNLTLSKKNRGYIKPDSVHIFFLIRDKNIYAFTNFWQVFFCMLLDTVKIFMKKEKEWNHRGHEG